MKSHKNARHVLSIAGLTWALAVLLGIGMLWAHEKRPGPNADVTYHWTVNVIVPFDSTRSNIVFYAHPKCPCTRAGLSELARLPGIESAKTHVVFFVPLNADESWFQGTSVELAKAIPEATIVFDRDGEFIRTLGVTTSGQCVAYHADGRLSFSGGVTVSRGHGGPNEGLVLLGKAIREEGRAVSRYPVYGCPLVAKQQSDVPKVPER